ncbi:DEAD/DEAH box helicase family protein [Isoptericola sp. b515]|uniref:sacsin N-terminal ATP-binding-like domain-containing protein n=1 Tax=Isoptericola sp. b515 TaxID=3064652 RepID=UPI00271383A7|nr:DEAD/DEAH box helicase family protein [Isoptericola sp. b515]MDO8147495.1 DEAD/DEAH box helicase family protein [Isoptericola sp. b515]
MAEQTDRCLEVYEKDPSRVEQDANNELRISSGGYNDRQLEELVQNAVDAARHGGERIEVVLTRTALYVANDGKPFDEAGLLSIMASDISTKDDEAVGKFGIGFKSVLAVSETPKVLSRSVSFGFDREWSEKMLRGEGYESTAYPTMRLSRLIDPAAEAASDPQLAELMDWASTVVVLPLSTSWVPISRRLYDFSAAFVLFSPHIKRAILRNLAEPKDPVANRGWGAVREVVAERDGGLLTTLRTGGTSSTWAVAGTVHRPNARELVDGGHVAARDEVTVRYAVAIPPGAGDGSFWAYFATRERTTLSGIVNAPWKLSDDRTRLLAGDFNEGILRGVVPRLVGDVVIAFDRTDDPVKALDVLPARGRESRGWADDVVNQPVFERMRAVRCLPDVDGVLHVPSELRWAGDIPARWTEAWAEVPGAPRDRWVHPDVNSNAERRMKVRRLLGCEGADDEGNAGIDEWLGALVRHGTVEESAEAIRVAALIVDDVGRHDERLRVRAQRGLANAPIVRLEDGTFRAPTRGKVFVRVAGDDRDDVEFVDPELAAMPGVREALAKLGVVVMDRSGELRALLTRAKQRDFVRRPDAVWGRIWEVLRDIPLTTALQILREDLGLRLELHTRVRTAAGTWVPPSSAFLGGAIVPADGSRDRDRLIDPRFHRADTELLREIGAVDAPAWRHDAPQESWLHAYDEEVRDKFIEGQSGPRPDRAKLVVDGAPPPWPLQPLLEMSKDARAAATRHILARGKPDAWTVRHTTNSSYGTLRVGAPEIYFVRKFGLLATTFGLLPPHQVLAANDSFDPRVLPVFEVGDQLAEAIGLRTDFEAFTPGDWEMMKAVADSWTTSEDDDARRSEFYTWLAGNLDPERLVVRVGRGRQSVERAHVGITDDPAVYSSMIEAMAPALLVSDSEDVDRLIEFWGLQPGKDLLQEEIVVERSGEPFYLTDAFPPLKLRLAPEDRDVQLQPCSRIVRMIATPQGQKAKPITALREDQVVHVTATDAAERLAQASEALGLGLDRRAVAKIFDEMERSEVNQRRQKIRRAPSDDLRLLEAVGEEALRRIVPKQALDALESRPEGVRSEEIAALARAVHGVGILKSLRIALEDAGLEPPKEWAGRRITRHWVTSHGFPADWAGFPSSQRPAVEVIDGPAVLGDLHKYQENVTDRIKSLLRAVGPDRGMVSLPTGAGKTRVAVEALVNGVRDGDIDISKPLVWIAQTDELCEQAAESWTYVWRAIGPQVPMRLGRLWASNDVPEEPGAFQLVVASIDKLRSVKDRAGSSYEWLRQPSVVVVDEAHTSIASSYTQVLEWLGRGARGRSEDVRRPLIGLTATPFRGTSHDETERLVKRYDGNRLDRGSFNHADDPYPELQEQGVLASVRQVVIDGTDVELTETDVDEIEKLRRLPSAVTERLGGDLSRTLRVVESIAQLPEDWTVIAFAPSVENSRVMAALLSHRGVPAVSISSDTESAARRHYVEEFKAGRIRVLTNYNVLTQGFDAPKVQAVFVARPTFAPNVYQQMIGRGLRGPKNGGSEEVLIVNVRDNFQKYGDMLAFNEFEYLWSR